MTRTGLFRYVRWEKVEEMHKAGWMIVFDFGDCHHSPYAVGMWHCGCADCEGWMG
jgi:hypothetical protein